MVNFVSCYGRKESNNQLRRVGEGEQESEAEVQGRSKAQRKRRGGGLRSEEEQITDPINEMFCLPLQKKSPK